MAWKHLTQEDMRVILSEAEIQTLDNTSVDASLSAVVNDAIDLVSDMFKGALKAKGFAVDTRDHYSPPEYSLRILQAAREVAWSRFPNSPAYALDDVRREQAKLLEDLLKDPYIEPSNPEWTHSSENPDNPDLPEDERERLKNKQGSIVVPFLRFDEQFRMWKGRGIL